MADKKENLQTPLMQQYYSIKSKYPDVILFFRLGDFYEMFGEDAVKAHPILEVVLTKRQTVPMCGVPYHSVNNYIRKLVKAGYDVKVLNLRDVFVSSRWNPLDVAFLKYKKR